LRQNKAKKKKKKRGFAGEYPTGWTRAENFQTMTEWTHLLNDLLFRDGRWWSASGFGCGRQTRVLFDGGTLSARGAENGEIQDDSNNNSYQNIKQHVGKIATEIKILDDFDFDFLRLIFSLSSEVDWIRFDGVEFGRAEASDTDRPVAGLGSRVTLEG
jgi:hypothetical protein